MKQIIIPAFSLLVVTSPAAAFNLLDDGIVNVSLLEGWAQHNGQHMAGIKVELAEGWHTYWRSPGEAGIPPRLSINASSNIEAIKIHWPKPEVYDSNGLRYVGYENEVIFPLELTPQGEGDLSLDAFLDIGVCAEICVPFRAHLISEMEHKTKPNIEIKSYLAKSSTSIEDVHCDITPIADGLTVAAQFPATSSHDVEHAVLEYADKSIWISQSNISHDGQNLIVTSDFVPESLQPIALSRSDITVSLFKRDGVYEAQGCPRG